ncbi:MAG TPA: glycosyltransferase family 4 protein [Actinomycetota bacterium]|jgi:glycosyltransferase involved in cell wall biosynthesis|nr:glycosyltransferase family 4 protein [Actinomycetota bacterium]
MSKVSGPSILRILVLTQMYPPHHHGGYEVLCRDVVERWRECGHDVEVLTTRYRLPSAADSADERVRRVLGFYWDDYRILSPSLRARLAIERGNQRALNAAIDELRPDVVSVWHMGAMSFGLLQTIVDRNVPIVCVVGDDWFVYGPTIDAWSKLFIGRPTLGRVVRRATGLPTAFQPGPDDMVACFASEYLRRRALEMSSIPLHRTSVVPHGIDLSMFEPETRTRRWSWRLLCVGRVEERKGAHVAVEGLALLPAEATLDIVGAPDDRYAERLVRTAHSLGVAGRVTFARAVPRDRLAEHYRSADAFLFPVVWDEPFGLVPLEAMACGTPVIATGTGGSAEFLVDGENCLLVSRGDAAALAGAVSRLAGDATLRDRLVRGGRATAERLGVDRLADALDEWDRSAANRFRDAPLSGPAPASASEPDSNA